MTHPRRDDDAWIVKDHRHNARIHDVHRLGCSPSSETRQPIVQGGHPALDRALARAAARNAPLTPSGALRAASDRQVRLPLPADEQPAPGGRVIDGMCITARRDDEQARVIHVATSRDIASRHGWYRIRVWRELADVSAN